MVRSTGASASSPTIAQMKMIVLALALGVAFFAIVVAFVGPVSGVEEGAPVPDGDGGSSSDIGSLLNYMLIALAVTMIPASLFMRGVLSKRVAGRKDEALAEIADGYVPAELAPAILVPAAMIESVGLFGCVTVLISGQTIALAAPAAVVVLLLMSVPTEQGLRESVESAGRLG